MTVASAPTLMLDDSGTATHTGLSADGTGSALTIVTRVAAGQNAPHLAVTGPALPTGATIEDVASDDLVPAGAAATFMGPRVDTMAPNAPTVALSRDTGASPTDGITTDPTLTVMSAEDGGTLLYSADGRHTVAVEQQDGAGNSSAPGSVTFTLDDTEPTVTIKTPGGNTSTAS